MEDQDVFHRSKITYNFLCDFNDVIDRQFEIYKKNLIKEILKELEDEYNKNIKKKNT
tara:strand:- start:107 stop:277 length:171 start_codon:yes stop_codon:yes gene_type:complete